MENQRSRKRLVTKIELFLHFSRMQVFSMSIEDASIFEEHYVSHHRPRKQTVMQTKDDIRSPVHTLGQLTRCVSDGRLIKVPSGSVPFGFRPWTNMPLIG